jgi:hypothetical protein
MLRKYTLQHTCIFSLHFCIRVMSTREYSFTALKATFVPVIIYPLRHEVIRERGSTAPDIINIDNERLHATAAVPSGKSPHPTPTPPLTLG